MAIKKRIKELSFDLKDAIRDIVFGMEDGLISNLGLVLGVAASGAPNVDVLIAGFASLFAGAVSMTAGDYLSTKSQREALDAQLATEEQKLCTTKNECQILGRIYRQARFTDKELRHFVRHLNTHKKLALKVLAEEELGIVPEKFENPVRGAVTIFIAYLLGAILPIMPFFFENTKFASAVSLAATGLTLFTIGAYKTKITKRNWVKSGLEMLTVALLAAVAGYVIGYLFGVQLS
jgi:VIT1/CCC1 family predicted Fe2+/Mn2+ transporter